MNRTVMIFIAPLITILSCGMGNVASCPTLRWTALGTAGGPIPTRERSEPANLLQAGDRSILVDAGDGASEQLARLGINVAAINTLFVSHLHQDHTAGIAGLIGLRWATSAPGKLVIYGPPGTKAMVEAIAGSIEPSAAVGYGFGEKAVSPATGVQVIEIGGGDSLQIGELSVLSAENSHYTETTPLLDGRHSVSLSYRFVLGSRSITYTGDTGPSDAVTKLANKTNLLVSEVIAVTPMLAVLQANPYIKPAQIANMRDHFEHHHLTPDAIGKIAADANVGELVLTHLAIPPGPLQAYEPYLRSGVRRAYPGPVYLASDLSSYNVGCNVGNSR